MEPLDLAGRGRRPGRGEQVLDAVLPTDPVEQHLHRRVVEPAGEHLAVVGQDLLGHARGRIATPARRTPAGCARGHQPRADTEPGVVIDPRSTPWPLVPSASRNPPTTSICHNSIGRPRSHRFHRRSRRRRSGVDQPGPDQRPVHRRLEGTGSTPRGQLEHDPPRPPPRMPPPQLQHRRLHLRRHLMRTRPRPMRPIRQTLQALAPRTGQPRMHRLPRHPTGRPPRPPCRPSAITASTA